MASTITESFIRKQIRRILREEAPEPDDKKPDDKPKPKESSASGQGKLYGGPGGGRRPAWLDDIIGKGKKADRLASTNPGKLMQNLGVGQASGETTIKRVENLIDNARNGSPVFGKAIGKGKMEEDGQGRKGILVPNLALPKDQHAAVFIYDTVRGAIGAGTLKLSGHLRLEVTQGGTRIYNVRNDKERWNS